MLGSNTRTTIFSPNAVAMLETRSSTSRWARWVLMRPSCGRRRSAMFMPAITLMRETIAPCTGERDRLDVVQDAVDAEADHGVLGARLEVDVRGALLEGVVEQVVDRRDHVLVVGGGGELVVRAQLDELHQRAAAWRRAPSCDYAWFTFERKP